MPRALLPVCFLVLAVSAHPALAGVGSTEVGRLEIPKFSVITNAGGIFGEYPHEPALSGDILYLPLGTFSDGFLSVDLSDPASPRLLTEFSAIRSRDVSVAGSMLYSVDGNEFHVVSVADPARPSLVGTLDLNPGGSGAAAASVAASGSRAFVTGGGPFLGMFPALRAIDISNPAAPRALGASIESGGADVALSGNTAYVAAYGAGLRIYDVSDPTSIRLLGSTGTLGDAAKVQVVGVTAYLFNTGSSFSLAIVDVSDPTRPSVLKVKTIPDEIIAPEFFLGDSIFHGMRIAAGRAYLAGWRGIVIVDIADPAAPEVLGNVGPDEFTGGVELRDDLVIAADRTGVVVLRLGAAPVAAGGPDLDSDGRLVLNGESSSDADGTIVAYRWHLQNRAPDGPSFDFEGPIVALGGVAPGVYQVHLTVEDDAGTLSEPLVFSLAVPVSADPADLDACREEVSELQDALEGARSEIVRLQGDLAAALATVTRLEEVERFLRGANDQLSFDVAEGTRGLEEIELLLKTPAGQRRSATDYAGTLGDRLDAIVEILVSPIGKKLNQ